MPFAGFKDFRDCIEKTMSKKKLDKERASKYCAAIMRKVEGSLEDAMKKSIMNKGKNG